MNRLIKGVLLVLLAVLLESSVLPRYIISPFRPDLLLIFMIYLALRSHIKVSLPAAYGLGLLKDCLSGLYLGLNAITFLIIYLVIKALSDRLYVQSSLLFVLTVSISTVSAMLINLVLLVIFSQADGLLPSMLFAFLPTVLVNAFVASVVSFCPGFTSVPVMRK
jgi:rod shape-determining protein MreD